MLNINRVLRVTRVNKGVVRIARGLKVLLKAASLGVNIKARQERFRI